MLQLSQIITQKIEIKDREYCLGKQQIEIKEQNRRQK